MQACVDEHQFRCSKKVTNRKKFTSCFHASAMDSNCTVIADVATATIPLKKEKDSLIRENIPPGELHFYNSVIQDASIVRYLRLHCTVCECHIGCIPSSANEVFQHKILKVLICKKCYLYTEGILNPGNHHGTKMCCWCGQKGKLKYCSNCPFSFCKKCLVRNFSQAVKKYIESNVHWLCFSCDPYPLWEHRAVCWATLSYISKEVEDWKCGKASERGFFGPLKPAPGDDATKCCNQVGILKKPQHIRSGMPNEKRLARCLQKAERWRNLDRLSEKSLIKHLDKINQISSQVKHAKSSQQVSPSRDRNLHNMYTVPMVQIPRTAIQSLNTGQYTTHPHNSLKGPKENTCYTNSDHYRISVKPSGNTQDVSKVNNDSVFLAHEQLASVQCHSRMVENCSSSPYDASRNKANTCSCETTELTGSLTLPAHCKVSALQCNIHTGLNVQEIVDEVDICNTIRSGDRQLIEQEQCTLPNQPVIPNPKTVHNLTKAMDPVCVLNVEDKHDADTQTPFPYKWLKNCMLDADILSKNMITHVTLLWKQYKMAVKRKNVQELTLVIDKLHSILGKVMEKAAKLDAKVMQKLRNCTNSDTGMLDITKKESQNQQLSKAHSNESLPTPSDSLNHGKNTVFMFDDGDSSVSSIDKSLLNAADWDSDSSQQQTQDEDEKSNSARVSQAPAGKEEQESSSTAGNPTASESTAPPADKNSSETPKSCSKSYETFLQNLWEEKGGGGQDKSCQFSDTQNVIKSTEYDISKCINCTVPLIKFSAVSLNETVNENHNSAERKRRVKRIQSLSVPKKKFKGINSTNHSGKQQEDNKWSSVVSPCSVLLKRLPKQEVLK